jgi:GT2 family glycosyltransferase
VTNPVRSEPPVVAVVVARDPGYWFEETLASLANQDYENLKVLVVDTGFEPVAERVNALIPDSIVLQDQKARGFGMAANRVLKAATGSSFYLFLQDDVCLEPQTVSVLINEAVISNAGVVGPKLVMWSDSERLFNMGASIDVLGEIDPFVEPGELDQQQHDRVRDAFVVSKAAMLVRSDLFTSIGGFDPLIEHHGVETDFCWRAQLAGGRILVVPSAVARERGDYNGRTATKNPRKDVHRYRLYTTSKCYGWLHLLSVLPFALLISALEIIFSMMAGRVRQARDVAAAWLWNAGRIIPILRARKQIKRYRLVRDRDLRRLQISGSVRLKSFLRGQIGGELSLVVFENRRRKIASQLKSASLQTVMAGWILVLLVVAFGSRHLITQGVPAIGQFGDFPQAGELLNSYWSGWREVGTGVAGLGPAALGLLGAGSTLTGGASELLRHVLIIGLLPIGLFNIWRLAGLSGTRRSRLVAIALYAANPLPYYALQNGRWNSLLFYAVLPLLLRRVIELVDDRPEAGKKSQTSSGNIRTRPLQKVAALALLIAVITAFEAMFLVFAACIGVVLCCFGSGGLRNRFQRLYLSLSACIVAGILHMPWWLAFHDYRSLVDNLFGAVNQAVPTELYRLVSFELGGGKVPWLQFAPLVLATISLLISRGRALHLATQAWSLCLLGFGFAWIASDNLLTAVIGPSVRLRELALFVAAVGVCWAASIGCASFEKNAYRIRASWRRSLIVTGVTLFILGLLPLLGAAKNGRWETPKYDLEVALSLIDDRNVGPSYRVLWIGDESILPLASWRLEDMGAGAKNLSIASSVGGYPDIRYQWAGVLTPGVQQLVNTVELGLSGGTSRLGRLLAPFGIRYVVVVEESAPSFGDGVQSPLNPRIRNSVRSHIDLRPIAADPAVLVFENESWFATRAQFDDGAVLDGMTDLSQLVISDLTTGVPVLLDRRSLVEEHGRLGFGAVQVAEEFDQNWRLYTGEEVLKPQLSFGWAMRFDSESTGPAALFYQRPKHIRYQAVLQIVSWMLVVRFAVRGQRTYSKDSISLANETTKSGRVQ